ncbi:MAG: hypothetical protein U0232_08870 [Thermomicrobiales bacterium]
METKRRHPGCDGHRAPFPAAEPPTKRRARAVLIPVEALHLGTADTLAEIGQAIVAPPLVVQRRVGSSDSAISPASSIVRIER